MASPEAFPYTGGCIKLNGLTRVFDLRRFYCGRKSCLRDYVFCLKQISHRVVLFSLQGAKTSSEFSVKKIVKDFTDSDSSAVTEKDFY